MAGLLDVVSPGEPSMGFNEEFTDTLVPLAAPPGPVSLRAVCRPLY
jgi:hypothetical protein